MIIFISMSYSNIYMKFHYFENSLGFIHVILSKYSIADIELNTIQL